MQPRWSTAQPILPRHPRWGEFIDRLAGPEACNFHGDRWTCFGDLRFSVNILREMGVDNPSIEVAIAYFNDHGGFCDCEVIFNVESHRPGQ